MLPLILDHAVTAYSLLCAFDKGQLSLDLPSRTIETNDNKKDFSWYKKR